MYTYYDLYGTDPIFRDGLSEERDDNGEDAGQDEDENSKVKVVKLADDRPDKLRPRIRLTRSAWGNGVAELQPKADDPAKEAAHQTPKCTLQRKCQSNIFLLVCDLITKMDQTWSYLVEGDVAVAVAS